MPSVPLQVTYLILLQFKFVTELHYSLLFVTRQLSFKIQPATLLWKFFHCSSQSLFGPFSYKDEQTPTQPT